MTGSSMGSNHNVGLARYSLVMRHKRFGSTFFLDIYAESREHAITQAEEDYPDAEVESPDPLGNTYTCTADNSHHARRVTVPLLLFVQHEPSSLVGTCYMAPKGMELSGARRVIANALTASRPDVPLHASPWGYICQDLQGKGFTAVPLFIADASG